MNIHSSCTCGIDEIRIDSTMKRLIYIGVFPISNELLSNSLIRQLQQTKTIWSWWITSINTRRIHITNKKKMFDNSDGERRSTWACTLEYVLMDSSWNMNLIGYILFYFYKSFTDVLFLFFFSHLPMCCFISVDLLHKNECLHTDIFLFFRFEFIKTCSDTFSSYGKTQWFNQWSWYYKFK